MLRTPIAWLGVSLLTFVASGASCPWMIRQPGSPIPQVLQQAATLDQIVAAVNDNTSRVRSGVASKAFLTVPGVPRLNANLAFEMPRRFRLQASIPISGPELDVGSNDELFWLWVRRAQPPAMFYCRHDQFAASNARRIMPVEPEWLLQALGLPTFQPHEELQGPFAVGAGRLEIRSRSQTASGQMNKITVVDAARALVLEQHLYDASGQRIASSVTSNHIHDGLSGANMPRQIDLQLPSSQMKLQIHVVDWKLNALTPEQAGMWTKPDYSATGAPNVDLADPNLQFQLPSQPVTGAGIHPRGNGGMNPENAAWSAASHAVQPGASSERMRLGQRFAPRQGPGAAPVGTVVSPPVVELPASNGALQ
jgi:hypothetical protein